jgi:choline-sulfatase
MTHPHDPYAVPHRYWERYRDSDIPMPRLGRADVTDDPHSRRLRHVIGLDLQTPTGAQIHAARRAYFGAVSYVDDQMGIVLDALRESALERDTIVLVVADHGDMLGERGLWYKMNFFEPACRIPLIVSAPGRFASRRSPALVSLLDIMPTLRELSGDERPAHYAVPVDGRSLVPELAGRDAPGEVIGEYLGEAAIAPVVMIRRGRHKFIHSPADPDQLFDLVSDPDERHNLAADKAQQSALAGFQAEASSRWSLPQLHQDVLASQRRRHLVYSALREGRYAPWDYQPIRDAARLYVRNDQELNDIEAMARFPPPGSRS